ncbi:uncharacterized protein LOC144757114 [Lissotriton helveticus]
MAKEIERGDWVMAKKPGLVTKGESTYSGPVQVQESTKGAVYLGKKGWRSKDDVVKLKHGQEKIILNGKRAEEEDADDSILEWDEVSGSPYSRMEKELGNLSNVGSMTKSSILDKSHHEEEPDIAPVRVPAPGGAGVKTRSGSPRTDAPVSPLPNERRAQDRQVHLDPPLAVLDSLEVGGKAIVIGGARCPSRSGLGLRLRGLSKGSSKSLSGWAASKERRLWTVTEPAAHRHLRLELQFTRMGRRRTPGKKVTAQCSRESVRATVPSLPLDVSASRSRKDTQRDQELEPLSENLPHIILLSMLEELEAKLDNLLNTVENVPSRVAGLIKKIWIEKDQGYLDNGAVSLEVVCPVSIRGCAVSRSPATPQLDRPGEPSVCLQPVFSDGHAPKQDCTVSSPTDVQGRPEEPNLCLQPMFPDRPHPQQDQCVQPGFPDGNGVQQDCPVSRCPQTDPPGRSLKAKLSLHSECVDGQTLQQDQSIQSAFPEQWEPDEPLKQEPSPLSTNSWDQQQNLCPHPLFPEGHEPQQNHSIQPALPDRNGPDDPLEEELMCFDFQDPQDNRSLQPVSPDGKSSDEHFESGLLSFDELGSQQTQCLQQHLCLKQELPYAQDPNVNYELESMRPGAQEPEQKDKLEPACTDAHGSDQKYKLEPLHTVAQD